MNSIKVNDIIDESVIEKRRLLNELLFANKCIKVLTQFKVHFDNCFNQLTTNLCSQDLQLFVDLDNKYKEVLVERQMNCDLNNEIIIDTNVNLSQNNESINSQTIDLKNRNSNSPEIESKIDIKINERNEGLVYELIGCGKSCLKKKCNSLTQKRVFALKGSTLKRRRHPNAYIQSNNCPIIECNESFDNKYEVMNHYKTVHSIDGKIVCNFMDCGKEFAHISYLRHHLLSHLGIKYKPLKCHVFGCDYRCVGNDELIAHMNGHNGIRPYVCSYPECNKSFTSNKFVKQHETTVHTIERRFKCDFLNCNRMFKTKKDLNQHLITHSNDKPFVCSQPNCQFRTKYIQNMERHEAITHSLQHRLSSTNSPLIIRSRTE